MFNIRTLSSTAARYLTIVLVSLVSAIAALFLVDAMSFATADVEGLIASTVFFTSSLILLIHTHDPKTIELANSSAVIQSALKSLSIQKLAIAAGSIAIGIIAAYIAGQTILSTSNNYGLLDSDEPTTTAYSNRQEEYSKLSNELLDKSITPTEQEAVTAKLTLLSKEIERIEKSGRLEIEAENKKNREPVDGVFLFRFFSNLFVRIGTIVILLYLFSVFVREYRKLDKRHLEFQQILLSFKLQEEGTNVELVKAARESIKIDDTPVQSETNEGDTQFADSYTDIVTKPVEKMSDITKSATQKIVQTAS